MKNNNLTILTPYFPTIANQYGGIFVYDQVKVMAEQVHHIDVFVTRPWFKISRKFPFIKRCGEDLKLKNINIANVSLRLVRYIPFPKDTIFYHLSLAVSLFFNKRKFTENVLTHTIYPLGAALQQLNVYSTIVVHGSDFRYFSKNSKQAKAISATVNKSNVVCVSAGLMEEVKELNGVITSESNIKVIENGVHISNQNIYPKVKTKDIDKKALKFIFVGSLIKLKGVYELVDAFSNLQKKAGHEGHFLTFVGGGIEKNTLKETLSKKNIENVSFLGAVDNQKVMEVLAQNDCLVLPSYQEGFGRVIIEMLSLGKPVIVTKSGGPEYIVNKQTGIIIPPRNVEALTDAMCELINNYETYFASQVKEYVKQNYCIEKQTSKLLDCVFREAK